MTLSAVKDHITSVLANEPTIATGSMDMKRYTDVPTWTEAINEFAQKEVSWSGCFINCIIT